MPEGILPDIRGGKPIERNNDLQVRRLSQRVEELERRLADVEIRLKELTAKRGPGRPPKAKAA